VKEIIFSADKKRHDAAASRAAAGEQKQLRGTYLFEKVLTASDTSPLGRIILPKVGTLFSSFYNLFIWSARPENLKPVKVGRPSDILIKFLFVFEILLPRGYLQANLHSLPFLSWWLIRTYCVMNRR
jgi:hypothetical protein